MPDAPPLAPADRAIVEAAFVGYNLRAGISSPDGDYAHRDRMRAALAAALPLVAEMFATRAKQHAEMVLTGEPDHARRREGMEASFTECANVIRALAARLAEAGNE